MSIVSFELTNYPVVEAVMRGVEKKSEPDERLSKSEAMLMQNKGREMIEHFDRFITGDEGSFSRNFVVGYEPHDQMHFGFWCGIQSAYKNIVTLEFPDYPFEQQHIFPDLHVALVERRKFDEETGRQCYVEYEARQLEPAERALGVVAMAHIEQ